VGVAKAIFSDVKQEKVLEVGDFETSQMEPFNLDDLILNIEIREHPLD
jgi:hypothetical protein